jgi:acetyl-CoA C-acetyltransferase
MRDAYVIGAGQSAFGSFPDETYLTLFDSAFDAALDSAGDFSPETIDEAFLGTLGVGGRQIGLSGPAVTEHVGLHGIPTTRIKRLCRKRLRVPTGPYRRPLGHGRRGACRWLRSDD